MQHAELTELLRSVLNQLDKLDGIRDDITEIKIIQAGQAKDLTHHIKRTDQNEELIKSLKSEVHSLSQWKWTVAGGLAVLVFILQMWMKLK